MSSIRGTWSSSSFTGGLIVPGDPLMSDLSTCSFLGADRNRIDKPAPLWYPGQY